jgi:hypothetical protein
MAAVAARPMPAIFVGHGNPVFGTMMNLLGSLSIRIIEKPIYYVLRDLLLQLYILIRFFRSQHIRRMGLNIYQFGCARLAIEMSAEMPSRKRSCPCQV